MHPYFQPADGAWGAVSNAFRRVILRRKPIPAFPEVLNIQTRSGCNARCVFCPIGKTEQPIPKGIMGWPLYEKLVREGLDHDCKRITPVLMNEPLLDPELVKRIRFV